MPDLPDPALPGAATTAQQVLLQELSYPCAANQMVIKLSLRRVPGVISATMDLATNDTTVV